jgi:hypothetical protein
MTSTVKWNGRTYQQYKTSDGDICMVDTAELIRDLDGTINEFNPRAPERMNTLETQRTCQWCRTAYRLSEVKGIDADRCPFCHRLI